jgi:hypothetical protein
MHSQEEYTWASPLELDGDCEEVKSELPLVWGGLDLWGSCCTHDGWPRDLDPEFTGAWDLPKFSTYSSESSYTLFKSMLFNLIDVIDLDGRSSFDGSRSVYCTPDRAFRRPPSASSEDIIFCATSDADAVMHSPIGLGWSWRLMQSPILEAELEGLEGSEPFGVTSGSFCEAPLDVPALSKPWDPSSNADMFLPSTVPARLARFLNRWDNRSWSFVWSELFAAIDRRHKLWSQISMQITTPKKRKWNRHKNKQMSMVIIKPVICNFFNKSIL